MLSTKIILERMIKLNGDLLTSDHEILFSITEIAYTNVNIIKILPILFFFYLQLVLLIRIILVLGLF